jgi:hypothetical protein
VRLSEQVGRVGRKYLTNNDNRRGGGEEGEGGGGGGRKQVIISQLLLNFLPVLHHHPDPPQLGIQLGFPTDAISPDLLLANLVLEFLKNLCGLGTE